MSFLEGLGTEAGRALVSQGTGWALCVAITLGASFIIWRLIKRLDASEERYTKNQEDAEKIIADLQEKRLAEARDGWERSTRAAAAMTELKEAVVARTQALNDMVIGFARFVSSQEASAERWHGRWKTLEQFHTGNSSRLEAVATELRGLKDELTRRHDR